MSACFLNILHESRRRCSFAVVGITDAVPDAELLSVLLTFDLCLCSFVHFSCKPCISKRSHIMHHTPSICLYIFSSVFHFLGECAKLDRVKMMGTRGKINAI